MFEIFAVPFGSRRIHPRLPELRFDPRDFGPGIGDRAGVDPAERIEQGPMASWIEQPAIVVLAVDLDRLAAEVPKHAGRDRRRANESPASAIALKSPPNDQRFAGVDLDALFAQEIEGGMRARQLELSRDGRAIFAAPDERAVRPRSQCQAERIEEDRFSGAGLASQHAEARLELK